jgi:hypothetical protein
LRNPTDKETTVTSDTTTYPTITDPAPRNGTTPSDGTGPATDLRAEGSVARPLADFLPGGPAADHLTVTMPSGDQVVVVGRADDGQVEVWSFGHIARRDPDTAVTAVSDSATWDGLVAAAVRGLAVQRNAATQRAAQAVTDRDRDREAHEQVLSDIRAYAVDKHLDGDICRDGLNAFLTAFGLPVFQPRVRVRYTVSGSYDVEGSDDDTARRDAHGYLKPDLSQLDNVIEDSDSHTVDVDSVEELDT